MEEKPNCLNGERKLFFLGGGGAGICRKIEEVDKNWENDFPLGTQQLTVQLLAILDRR